jgi:hypothetical protein
MTYKQHKLWWMLPGESRRRWHGVHLLQRQAGRCAACKAVFDPDLEPGSNANVVVRREPVTGEVTRRWSSKTLADA